MLLQEVRKRPQWRPVSLHGASQPARIDGCCSVAPADAWRKETLVSLCSRLEHTDHQCLRQHMGTMSGIVAAALATYGDSQQHVIEVARIYADLRRRLSTHMFREEHGLYSSICNIERNRVQPVAARGIVMDAIDSIRREHRHIAKTFRRIASLLRDYEVPLNAGVRYRALIDGFRELESLKIQHMQSEEVVYSRVLALERELMHK